MPQRMVPSDVELNEHFELKPLDSAENADGLTLVVTCKHCKELRPEAKPKEWELEMSVDGGIDRGSRNSLLSHAASHFTKPKLRPRL